MTFFIKFLVLYYCFMVSLCCNTTVLFNNQSFFVKSIKHFLKTNFCINRGNKILSCHINKMYFKP